MFDVTSLIALRPANGFTALLADPPLRFQTRSPKGESRSPQSHYDCPSFDELKALPVAEIAAPDAFLFLWIPLRSPDLIMPLMEAWGFQFSGTAFVWAKLNARGCGWFMSTGFGTRKNVEICWLGRRGRPQRLSKGVRELVIAPRREHSRKPDETYARIEALSTGPFLEMFARQRWPGWSSWGDELDRFPIAPASARITIRGEGEWLEIYCRGRVEWNFRARDGRHTQEYIDIDHVANFWPELVSEVERAVESSWLEEP